MGTGVMMRIWLGKDGRSRCKEESKGVYKVEEISRKGDQSTILRQICNKPISYINSCPLVFLPCFCP